MIKNCLIPFLLFCFFIEALTVRAEVKLSSLFGSGMVLQRNEEIQIWGKADKSETIKITFNNSTYHTTCKDSAWLITVSPMKAGGPFTMVIEGTNRIVLNNILIGDVWICSGQSNMAWTVANSKNAEKEIANANYPEIRFFKVPDTVSLHKLDGLENANWQICTSGTVSDFSAVGYFFGRNIHQSQDVPVGLINASWGGTLIESWMSEEAISHFPEYKSALQNRDKVNLSELLKEKLAKKEEILNMVSNSKGIIDGEAVWASEDYDDSHWRFTDVPGLWEHKGLTGLDGVVWYKKTIDLQNIPDTNEQAVLSLGKIDDNDKTWLNGKFVGETNKYNQPRDYKIPAGVLKKGTNTITVRIEDTKYGGGFWSEANELYLAVGKDTISIAGEWKYNISPENLEVSIEVLGPNDYPTVLYNGMIYPLRKMAVKGCIWYQGEANTSNAAIYGRLFPAMIKDWRKTFNNDSLAFLFVQLANYMQACEKPCESDWAELREAQAQALSLPFSGMAVTIDIGEAGNIHPKNKQDVGYRLSLAARKVVYNEDIIASGPALKNTVISGDTVILEFNSVGDGLKTHPASDALEGFQIAGENCNFALARAKIKGKTQVMIFAEGVKNPKKIRYAWADNPEKANLFNSENLPASPFRIVLE